VTHPTTTFAGRAVAVTGGAGDIGLATAGHLGRLGAVIALVDLDAATVEAARAALEAEGIAAHAWPVFDSEWLQPGGFAPVMRPTRV
jgi:NAD(P)-dependent dehydrogenase (short-subunit alcohol dehydrogenase family)